MSISQFPTQDKLCLLKMGILFALALYPILTLFQDLWNVSTVPSIHRSVRVAATMNPLRETWKGSRTLCLRSKFPSLFFEEPGTLSTHSWNQPVVCSGDEKAKNPLSIFCALSVGASLSFVEALWEKNMEGLWFLESFIVPCVVLTVPGTHARTFWGTSFIEVLNQPTHETQL